MSTLQDVWLAVEQYAGKGTKSFRLRGCRARLYLGAMAIPIVAFHTPEPPSLEEPRLRELSRRLEQFGLEIECVEEGHNYKVNRSDTKAYVGRITGEALKLHTGRIAEIGRAAFDVIIDFYLQNPGPGG
jgi:hypothetical protein